MKISRFQVGCGLAGGLVSYEDATMEFHSSVYPIEQSLQMNETAIVSDRG